MDVLSIVEKYLRDNKLDGLCNGDAECACELGDLAPCGEIYSECTAGKKTPCDCGDGHAFHINEAPGK